MPRIQRLYPTPSQEFALHGLYLEHAVHRLGSPEQPFVYANFLASLDGRIALIDPATERAYLPEILTNPNDFRLFLELHAQADCLITHGGYLRALAKGTLGNILQAGTRKENADLARWRQNNGFSVQPAIVIASASLDFPMPPSIRQQAQPCYIATGKKADPGRLRFWRDQDYPILFAGDGQLVQGKALVAALGRLGFRSIYLIAGPQMLDTMLREGQLSRLYQTLSLQLIGGEDFHTLLPGSPLGRAGRLQLKSLYLDAGAPEQSAQLFARFDIRGNGEFSR